MKGLTIRRIDPYCRAGYSRTGLLLADPYPYYDELRSRVPAFYWSDYGKWTFVRHQDVNTRSFAIGALVRQLSHVVESQGRSFLPRSHVPELRRFYEIEERSLLQLEPP